MSAPRRGALVISLDFELHWGVLDRHTGDGPYRGNLLGARAAVPRMLDLFQAFSVGATWATVGFLFARSRGELERFKPGVRPAYADRTLCPYGQTTGEGESDDPIHFAPSLIETIRATPRQEIATHTYSHYYCLEQGQGREAFTTDLAAARAIAAEREIELRSIVFPRNQHNPAYDGVLLASGITAFRGNPLTWMWGEATRENVYTPSKRIGRLADAYVNVSGPYLAAWDDVLQPNGLANVPASLPLRPYSRRLRTLEGLRARRLANAMEKAARTGRIFHLWWHPHNFGAHIEENLALLRRVLEAFDRCRQEYGMHSMTMREVAQTCRAHFKTTGATIAASTSEFPTHSLYHG